MKAYKIRDGKTGDFYSENKTPSKDYATIWYSLEELVKYLRSREHEESMRRNVYSGYGEMFSGSLLPESWEIVEVNIEEVSAVLLTEVLEQAANDCNKVS